MFGYGIGIGPPGDGVGEQVPPEARAQDARPTRLGTLLATASVLDFTLLWSCALASAGGYGVASRNATAIVRPEISSRALPGLISESLAEKFG